MTAVAIVLRTKNRPLLLARALEDISSQSHTDWELVVVNDGGDAAELERVVAEYSARLGNRVQVLHNLQSRGMEAAANQGVRASTAPLVTIHDDDDTWASDFLAASIAALDADPEAVATVVATDIVIEAAAPDGTFREMERRTFAPPLNAVTYYDLIITNRVVPISMVLRRAVLEELGGLDETLPVVGDWEFNLRLALHGDIVYLPQPSRAFWHQRPDALGATSNSVIGDADAHARFDRVVRDRAVREYVRQHGAGALLYLSRHVQDVAAVVEARSLTAVRESEERIKAHIDRRVDALQERLNVVVHEHTRYHSVAATVQRLVRRANPFRHRV